MWVAVGMMYVWVNSKVLTRNPRATYYHVLPRTHVHFKGFFSFLLLEILTTFEPQLQMQIILTKLLGQQCDKFYIKTDHHFTHHLL